MTSGGGAATPPPTGLTSPPRNLILTGGCALNCVCNGKILRGGQWDDLFIPNMCEDQGNIVGRMVMEYGQKIDGPFIYNRVKYPVPDAFSRVVSPEELAGRILGYIHRMVCGE